MLVTSELEPRGLVAAELEPRGLVSSELELRGLEAQGRARLPQDRLLRLGEVAVRTGDHDAGLDHRAGLGGLLGRLGDLLERLRLALREIAGQQVHMLVEALAQLLRR